VAEFEVGGTEVVGDIEALTAEWALAEDQRQTVAAIVLLKSRDRTAGTVAVQRERAEAIAAVLDLEGVDVSRIPLERAPSAEQPAVVLLVPEAPTS
jgi:hypothetical protein